MDTAERLPDLAGTVQLGQEHRAGQGRRKPDRASAVITTNGTAEWTSKAATGVIAPFWLETGKQLASSPA